MASTGGKRISSRSRDKHRSRSGCGTCRIRKVKCDESFPACSRCLSTGRACDGYGIWGGGGGGSHLHGTRRARDGLVVVTSPSPSYIPILVATAAEKECFDWFHHRTLYRLPGSFNNDFWSTLLPQACISEPAVFSAVLALTRVHRWNAGLEKRRWDGVTSLSPVDRPETFALKHYLQAIAHLQPIFSTRDRTSIRVILIACIVFISIDLLRGHFDTARNHVRCGLRLIADMQEQASNEVSGESSDATKPRLEFGRDPIDDWIIVVLSRLHIHINLCQPPESHSHTPLLIASPHPLRQVFDSRKTAWLELDRLHHQLTSLTYQAHQDKRNPLTTSPIPSIIAKMQHSILTELENWSKNYKASQELLLGGHSIEDRKAYIILTMYHTMMTIMAHTCLKPGDETIFDSYTDHFLLLLGQAEAMFSIWDTTVANSASPWAGNFDAAGSIIDVGCVPQLYYTALKCRVYGIRHKAAGFLERMVHREGIWDSKIAASAARRVIELEEGHYYDSLKHPQRDLEMSLLPPPYRLREVEAVYSGEPLDKVMLFCKGRHGSADDSRVCIEQYAITSRT